MTVSEPRQPEAEKAGRIRRDFVILSFSTYEQAMEVEEFCRTNAISGRLIPLPPQVHAGCGLCWRMDPESPGPEKQAPENTGSGNMGPGKQAPVNTGSGNMAPGKQAPENTGFGNVGPGNREGAVMAAVDRIRSAGLPFEGPHRVSMWTIGP